MESVEGHKEREVCFITFQTVDWTDVFIRPVYKQVIVHSLNYFIESKGLVVHAWGLMTHHLQLLAQAGNGSSIAELEKEYKAFTTKKILEAIDTEPDRKKDWMLKRFENFSNLPGFLKKYNVWQDGNHTMPIDMNKSDLLLEHVEAIHHHPVRDKVVDLATEYLYSSARDYSGFKGLVNIVKLPSIEQQLAAAETMNGHFHVKYIRN